jgi:hypothetical protein
MDTDVAHTLRTLKDFLARYGYSFGFWLVIIVASLVKLYRRREWATELLASPLLAEWSERRLSGFGGGIEGVWLGRRATLRSCDSKQRGSLAIEASVATMTAGRFLIERTEENFLARTMHIDAPPLVESIDPADRVFRVRSSDRTLTDRLLGDAKAREALLETVLETGDAVRLDPDRYVVRRYYPDGDAPEQAVAASLGALREMARVLG